MYRICTSAPCEHQVHAFDALGNAFAGDLLGSGADHADLDGHLPVGMELALLVADGQQLHVVAVAKLGWVWGVVDLRTIRTLSPRLGRCSSTLHSYVGPATLSRT